MSGGSRRSLLVFLALAAAYALASTGRVHVQDEACALFQARGLVEEGALVVPEAAGGFEFYGKRDRDGRPRAPYGPAHAIAVAPFYVAGRALARAPGVPREAADLVATLACVLSSAIFAAAAVALFHRLLERRGAPPEAALGAAAAVAFGTPLFFYAGTLFSEPLSAALLAGAALALFWDARPVPARRAAAAGLLLAACVLVRPAHAIAAALFGGAILVRDGPRRGAAAFATLGLLAAAGAGAYLAWNWSQFGDPLDFGYPEAAEGGRRLNDFSTPLWRGLFGFLLSPGKSIFLFAPVALVAIAGLRRLWARDAGLGFLAAALPAAYVLFYAKYAQWEGGYCYGPRYLVPTLPLLCAGIGPFLETAGRSGRRLLLGLALAGALVQSIGLATSFLEDQRRGGYYDERWQYRLDHAPIVSQGRLLAHYTAAAVRGDPPPPLGKGFDRWFVFLRRAGVPWPPIAALIFAEVSIAAAAGAALLRARNQKYIQRLPPYQA